MSKNPQFDVDRILKRQTSSPFLKLQLNVGSSRFRYARSNDFFPDDPYRSGDPDQRWSLVDPKYQTTGAAAASRLSDVAGDAEFLLDSLGDDATPEEREQLRAIIAAGGHLPQEKQPGMVGKFFGGLIDWIDRPRKTANALIADAFNIGQEFSSGEAIKQIWGGKPSTDPSKAAGLQQWRSEDGELTFTGSQLLGASGWNPTTGFGKFARGTLGFAADVAFDPLSWVSFGTLGLGKSVAAAGARGALSTATREATEQLVKRGVLDDVVDPLTRYMGELLQTEGKAVRESLAKKLADAEAERLGRKLKPKEIDELKRVADEQWYLRQQDQAALAAGLDPAERALVREGDEAFQKMVDDIFDDVGSPLEKVYNDVSQLITDKQFRTLETRYSALIESKFTPAHSKGGLTITTPFMRKQTGGISLGIRTNREISKPIREAADKLWKSMPYDKTRGAMESLWVRRSNEAIHDLVRREGGAWNFDLAMGLAQHAARKMGVDDAPGLLESGLRQLATKADELQVDQQEVFQAMARLLDEGWSEGLLARAMPHPELAEVMGNAHQQVKTVMDMIHSALKKYDPNMGKIENYFPMMPSEKLVDIVERLGKRGLTDDAAALIDKALKNEGLTAKQRFGLTLLSEFVETTSMKDSLAGTLTQVVDHTKHQNPRLFAKTLMAPVGSTSLQLLNPDAVAQHLYGGAKGQGVKAGWASRVDLNEAMKEALELLSDSGLFGRVSLDFDPFSMDLPQVLNSYVNATSNVIHFNELIVQGKRMGLVGQVPEALEVGNTLAALTSKAGPMSEANRRLLRLTRDWVQGEAGKPTWRRVDIVEGWAVDLPDQIADHPRVASALKNLRKQAENAAKRTAEHKQVIESQVRAMMDKGLPETVAREVATVTTDGRLLEAQAAILSTMQEQVGRLRSTVQAKAASLPPEKRIARLREADEIAEEWGRQARESMASLRDQWWGQFGSERISSPEVVNLLEANEDGIVPLAVLVDELDKVVEADVNEALLSLPAYMRRQVQEAASTGDMRLSVERAIQNELEDEVLPQAVVQAWGDIVDVVTVANLDLEDAIDAMGAKEALDVLRELAGFVEPPNSNGLLRGIAEKFTDRYGRVYRPRLVDDIGDTKMIATEYQALPTVDNAAIDSFEKLFGETLEQAEALREAGVELVPVERPRYRSVAEQLLDVRRNNRLEVSTQMNPADPSFFNDPGRMWEGIPIGNLFDAVHLVMGHAVHGFGNTLEDVTQAWLAHGQTFSDEARDAFTTLTRGRRVAGREFGEAGYVPRKVALMDEAISAVDLDPHSPMRSVGPIWASGESATVSMMAKNVDELRRLLMSTEAKVPVKWDRLPAEAAVEGDPWHKRVMLANGEILEFADEAEYQNWYKPFKREQYAKTRAARAKAREAEKAIAEAGGVDPNVWVDPETGETLASIRKKMSQDVSDLDAREYRESDPVKIRELRGRIDKTLKDIKREKRAAERLGELPDPDRMEALENELATLRTQFKSAQGDVPYKPAKKRLGKSNETDLAMSGDELSDKKLLSGNKPKLQDGYLDDVIREIQEDLDEVRAVREEIIEELAESPFEWQYDYTDEMLAEWRAASLEPLDREIESLEDELQAFLDGFDPRDDVAYLEDVEGGYSKIMGGRTETHADYIETRGFGRDEVVVKKLSKNKESVGHNAGWSRRKDATEGFARGTVVGTHKAETKDGVLKVGDQKISIQEGVKGSPGRPERFEATLAGGGKKVYKNDQDIDEEIKALRKRWRDVRSQLDIQAEALLGEMRARGVNFAELFQQMPPTMMRDGFDHPFFKRESIRRLLARGLEKIDGAKPVVDPNVKPRLGKVAGKGYEETAAAWAAKKGDDIRVREASRRTSRARADQLVNQRMLEAKELAEGRGLSGVTLGLPVELFDDSRLGAPRWESSHIESTFGPNRGDIQRMMDAIQAGDARLLAEHETTFRSLMERIGLDSKRIVFDPHSDGSYSLRYLSGPLETVDDTIAPQELRDVLSEWVPFNVYSMSTGDLVSRVHRLIGEGALTLEQFPERIQNFLRRVPDGKLPIEAEQFDNLAQLLAQLSVARSTLRRQMPKARRVKADEAAEALERVLEQVEPMLRHRVGNVEALDNAWDEGRKVLEQVLTPKQFDELTALVEQAPIVRSATARTRALGRAVAPREKRVSDALDAFERAKSEVMQEVYRSGIDRRDADDILEGLNILMDRQAKLIDRYAMPDPEIRGEANPLELKPDYMQATTSDFEIEQFMSMYDSMYDAGKEVRGTFRRLSRDKDFQSYVEREMADVLQGVDEPIEEWIARRGKELGKTIEPRKVQVRVNAGTVRPETVQVAGRALADQEVNYAFAVLLENMSSAIQATSSPLGIKVVADQLRGFERYWKGAVTVGRPTFVPRNVIGGVWNSMVADTGVREYAWLGGKARKVREVLEGGLRLEGGKLPEGVGFFDEVLRQAGIGGDDAIVFRAARDMRIFDTEFVSDIADPLLGQAERRSFNPFAGLTPGSDKTFVGFDVGGKFMQTSEDFLRMAVFKRWFDPSRPETALLAKEMVFAVHFDYSSLTRLETMIKKVVPFYVWTRRNIPLQVRLMMERPGIWNRYASLQRNVETSFEDGEYSFVDRQPIPRWMSSQAADLDIVVDRGEGLWTRMLFSPDLPTRDLEQLVMRFNGGNPITNGIGFVGDMLSPAAQIGGDFISNDSSMDGRKVTAPTGLAGVLKLLNAAGLWMGDMKGDEPQIGYRTRSVYETIVPFAREWSEVAGMVPNDGMRAGDLGYRLDDGVSMGERALGAFMGIGKAFGLRGTTPHDSLSPAMEADDLIKSIERAAQARGVFGIEGAKGAPREPKYSKRGDEWFGLANAENQAGQRAEQAHMVVDGDTIQLRLGDGTYERVRLLGINTPENGEVGAMAAKKFLEDLLAQGGRVRTVRDLVDEDAYGRKLRYVWVGDRMLNLELVNAGLADPQAYYPNRAFEALLNG